MSTSMVRRVPVFGATAVVAALALLGTSFSSSAGASSAPKKGGVASLAIFSSGPNYVLPFFDAANFTQVNISDLQYLLYRPLYWFGTGSTPAINYKLSIGQPPVYTDGGKVVTIKLNHYTWSDGTPVTARDVLFWQNLMIANKANWGAYTPGDYPDNIASTTAINPSTIQFTLTKAYDTNWFTYNELSQITPLPQQAWDKTSPFTPDENFDTTPATAVKVYNYLNAESTDLSTYTTNPLWKVVDGPWKMSAYTPSNGAVSFVPNPDYSGPEKPHLSQFNEQVFTTTDAEFNDLISGSGPQVGYISPVEVKSQSALDRVGYSQDQSYSFSVAYTQINFNNPKVGPLFKQTYIRQALQMLVDQAGLTKHYFGGFGYNTCGPVPTEPANSFADSYVAKCPFNYNPTRAVSTLKAHGWKVVPGGISTCAHPGTGSGECGAGITSGEPLKFTYLYGSGGIAFPKSMAQQKSDAEAAGVDYVLDGEPGSQVEEAAVPCTPKQPACSWQMAYAGWIYSPDYYPTGETLFATGAGYNVGSYSDPQTDKLINATTEPGNPQQTLDAYQNYIADQLPVLWQGGTTSLNEVSNKLHGVTPFNVFGNILPEEWYYTK